VWDLIGPRQLPIEVRAVEGRYLVTAKLRGLPPDTPIAVGDEVLSVDGEALADAVHRRWKFFTGSTEAGRTTRVLELAMRGARDSTAVLQVRGADGQTRRVEIARARGPFPAVTEGETWHVLAGNIGYVDLTRLTTDQVDAMFDALMGTQAIVFDMRGYPQGAGWPIASRLDRKGGSAAAIYCHLQVTAFVPSDWAQTELCFEQVLAPTDKPKYLMLGSDAARVEIFAGLGVRVIQLTYNAANQLGDGSVVAENRGLSPFGHEVVDRLNANRIMVDLSHSGEHTCLDAARASRQPSQSITLGAGPWWISRAIRRMRNCAWSRQRAASSGSTSCRLSTRLGMPPRKTSWHTSITP